MLTRITRTVLMIGLLSGAMAQAQDGIAERDPDTLAIEADTALAEVPCDDIRFVVYYFHGEKRCLTCRKIESLAQRSLKEGFADALADSAIQWRVVNFEDEANAQYAKAYKLFTQTLIVSRYVDGEETGWINLDQIWRLVHDEDAFMAYVHDEVMAFMQAKLE